MYTIFKNLTSKPILIIAAILLIIILILTAQSAISSVLTYLGWNTEENTKTRLVKTEHELDKAVDIIESKKKEIEISKKIDEVSDKVIDDLDAIDKSIVEEEKDIIVEVKEKEISEVKNKLKSETKPEVKIKEKITEVFIPVDNTISESELLMLKLILKRHKKLGGKK